MTTLSDTIKHLAHLIEHKRSCDACRGLDVTDRRVAVCEAGR